MLISLVRSVDSSTYNFKNKCFNRIYFKKQPSSMFCNNLSKH